MIIVDLLTEYGPEVGIFVGFSLLSFVGLVSLSKYYFCPEVYTIDKGGRSTNYRGRKWRYKKTPKKDGIKAVMKIIPNGWLSSGFKTITIPEDIEVESVSPTKWVIRARNIKYDFNRYKSLIPTNEEFEAIHPDETVFNDQIAGKLKNTNTEVRKGTNANPEVSRWQKTSGSIPLSAAGKSNKNVARKMLNSIGDFSSGSESSEDEEESEDDEDYGKEEARSELERLIGGAKE